MDWNNDGLKDLLTGESNGRVRYYRNIGEGGAPLLTFAGYLYVGTVYLTAGPYSAPWVNDWNEDGKKDLLVGNVEGRVALFLNVGTNANPSFTSSQILRLANGDSLDVGQRNDPAIVDLDGDGLKDLVCGALDGKLHYFRNLTSNANPQLAPDSLLCTGAQIINLGDTNSPAPIDWNGDGRQDLVVGNFGDRLKRYMQESYTPLEPFCNLTNVGPAVIPPSGGSFNFNFTVVNPSPLLENYDLWTEIQYPLGGIYTNVLTLQIGLVLAAGDSSTHLFTQTVPGSLPTGIYKLHGYVGRFSTLEIYSQDYVMFTRSTTDDSVSLEGSGGINGEVCTTPQHPETKLSYPLLAATPNPFNPSTTLSFYLAESSPVQIRLYNCAGQMVALLVDAYYAAGEQKIILTTEGLTSGIYFAKLVTKEGQAARKLCLIR